MDNNKDKIRRLARKSRWKMIIFTVVVNLLLFWQTAIDYYFYLNFNFLFARRAFKQRTRAHVHWVGSHIAKPHRMASFALAFIVLAGIFTAPHQQLSLQWAVIWGSLFSAYVIYKSCSILLQQPPTTRERQH